MTESHPIKPEAPASRTRGVREWRVLAFLLAGLAVLAPALNLRAQSNGAPAFTPPVAAPGGSSNRFLFVVDTSAAMKRQLADVVGVVQGIIRSDANGQLHNGDTIGVWTFNETIYTGNLPLQEWVADDSEEIALRMTEFFRQQPFEKRSRFDLVQLGLAEIVKHSDIITVFIISDGSGRMQGTPFDQQINAAYVQNLQDMKKDRRPIVTVLQAKGGRFIRFTVNAVPWPVVIPEVPISIKLANIPPARPAPTATKTVETNTAVPPATPAVVAPQTTVATAPAPVAPAQPMTQPPAVIPTQTTAAPPAIPPQISSASAPAGTTPTPSVSSAARTTPTPAVPVPIMPGPGPLAAKPQTSGPGTAAPQVTGPVLPRPATATNLVVAQNNPPRAPSPKPAQLPGSASNPAPTLRTTPATTVVTNAATPPARTNPSLIAQGSALIKSFAGEHPRILLVGGGVLIVAALGLIVALVRRSRRPARISLISQMMDDQQQ